MTVKRHDVIQKLNILKRNILDNKYDTGKVLIFAGSFGMAGAAVMCARGALRGGAGLVTCVTSADIIPIIQACVPQAMCKSLSSDLDLSKYDSIVFGPGFLIENGKDILRMVLREYDGVIVLDAEAINIISRENLFNELVSAKADIVITPHKGEAERLLGQSIYERKTALEEITKKTGKTVLLKGHKTLVQKGLSIYENDTGNPALAIGGSGDVLSGIIGAFAAGGMDSFFAASAGAFVHGMAADNWADENGTVGMTVDDLLCAIPPVINEIIGYR